MKNSRDIESKIRKKKIGLIFILLILFTTIFIILLTRTSFFHLSKVEVYGNKTLDKDRIVMASGLVRGENIFKINISGAEKNLLRHPYVKKVDIKRRFPNKVNIKLEERDETLVIPYIGSYVYVDNNGIILNILAARKEDTLIQLEGLDMKEPIIGETVRLEGEEDFGEIISFITACSEIGINDKIIDVTINDEFRTFFILNTGTKVAFGELNDVKYKLQFILTILKKREDEGETIMGTIDFTKGVDPVFIEDSM